MNKGEAQRDISFYLMDYYNLRRPHQFNNGVPPAKAEDRLSGQTTTLKIDKCLSQLSGRFCIQLILFNGGMSDKHLFR
jgi:hypothetical protein